MQVDSQIKIPNGAEPSPRELDRSSLLAAFVETIASLDTKRNRNDRATIANRARAQKNPNRFSHRAAKMRDGGIAGDDQIQVGDDAAVSMNAPLDWSTPPGKARTGFFPFQ